MKLRKTLLNLLVAASCTAAFNVMAIDHATSGSGDRSDNGQEMNYGYQYSDNVKTSYSERGRRTYIEDVGSENMGPYDSEYSNFEYLDNQTREHR